MLYKISYSLCDDHISSNTDTETDIGYHKQCDFARSLNKGTMLSYDDSAYVQ